MLAVAVASGGAVAFGLSGAGRIWRADRAIARGRLGEAEALLIPLALAEEPAAITRLARIRLLQGRPEGAFRLLESRPGWREDPERLAILGEAGLATGRIAEAMAAYGAILARRPDDIPALIRSAELTYRHAGLAQALIPYRHLAELQPGEPRWPMAVGRIYMEIDRYELAASSFGEAARLAPDDADVRFALAEAEFLAGRLPECLADLDQVGRARPEDPRIEPARAECLLAMGQTEAAAGRLEAILTRDPAHTRALRLLGEISLRRGELTRALGLLERARDVAPRDWRVLYQLARAYDRLGRRDEARAAEARMRECQRDAVDRS